MTAHELAQILLSSPDVDVVVAMPEPAGVSLGSVAMVEIEPEAVILETEFCA